MANFDVSATVTMQTSGSSTPWRGVHSQSAQPDPSSHWSNRGVIGMGFGTENNHWSEEYFDPTLVRLNLTSDKLCLAYESLKINYDLIFAKWNNFIGLLALWKTSAGAFIHSFVHSFIYSFSPDSVIWRCCIGGNIKLTPCTFQAITRLFDPNQIYHQ